MFKRHVIKELPAYCHGKISTEDSERIVRHLLSCRRCSQELEQIKFGISLVECLPQASAPESMWSKIEVLLDEQQVNTTLQPNYFQFLLANRWPRLATLGTALFLILGLSAVWYYSRSPKASWEVVRIDGAPIVGSNPIGETGRLLVGEWLETDSSSKVKIRVGQIGNVEVEPNTRIRLVETRSSEHRLALERGSLHARIFAPPRLFFVETPSATAVDLGCAYTLKVDSAGRSLLHVTSGWVALQLKDRESIVPAGALCETRKGIGPGTPYFEDASERFRNALSKLDFEKETTEALGIVLAESRERDSLTLWHLLSRLAEPERAIVYDRLAALIPPPDGVTRSGVLQLNRQMLDAWKTKLESIRLE
ncbi:MAG: FecR domain-containing protein [Acidobacteriota bacterium]